MSKMEEDMTAYLFVDTIAFEKLAMQPECRVGQRNATMTGYETYLIEQWACERRVNTAVASYTGNSQHVIEVQVLLVPTNYSKWSAVTFGHFDELMNMHILPKETKLGLMLVTSLSSLPTNLTLVSMPRKYRVGYSNFVVNEDLRRLNVVGRIGVTADDPSESLIASFRRSFSVSSEPNAVYAVQELVTLMQIALFYFGLLDPSYVDGLLCDYTLRAMETWWSSVGRQRYRTVVPPRPRDRLYMRTSCAALVGIAIGARQRLSAMGLKPPKDPFDAEEFVVSIRRFQKMLKLPRTAMFDDVTYSKLVAATSKNGSLATSTTNVLTIMKSTVKEGLSGKAAEAVDDWETIDIDVLARNARGERCKYLWQGKGEPVVNHLRGLLSTQAVGELTKIPLFSLPNVPTELDRDALYPPHLHHLQHLHLHNQTPGQSQSGTQHHSSLHHHQQQHHQTGSTGSAGYLYQSPSASSTGPLHSPAKTRGRSGSTDPASASTSAVDSSHQYFSDTTDPEGDDKYKDSVFANGAAIPDQHKSLVNRFRRRSTKPSALAEAFDDSAVVEFLQHARRHSASSDHWFIQHHGDAANLGSTLNLPQTALEQTTLIEEEEPSKRTADRELASSGAGGSSSGGGLNSEGYSMDHTNISAGEKTPKYRDIPISELLTKDDLALLKYDSHHERTNHLRRTASLSPIEGTIFPWDGLAPVPEIVSLRERAQHLQAKVDRQMHDDVVIKQDLCMRIAANESNLAECLRDNTVIKYHISASTKKEEAVHRRLNELKAFMARLDYELASLTVKLNDVDQSVLAFAAKVDSADSKWNQMNKEQPSTWWSRWIKS